MYAEFDLETPEHLEQALALLAEGDDGHTLPLAGGTNLLVDLRARRVAPRRLVSIGRIASLRGVSVRDGRVRVGGVTTISDLLHDATLASHAPALVAQARLFAGQMVRNTATVAGNLCCGSPAADCVPPLMALGAEVDLLGRDGLRTISLVDFCTGYRQTARRDDELLTAVHWALSTAPVAHRFHKLARRRGDAITVVGVAVGMRLADGVCQTPRIALGAVAPTVLRATEAESLLEGHALTADRIMQAARSAADASRPIDDVRASAAYRRDVVRTLTQRLLGEAWGELKRGY